MKVQNVDYSIEKNRPYRIYYGMVRAKDIFNYVGYTVTPARIAKVNARTGFYRLLEESILEKGIRNPILVCSGWPYGGNWRLAKRIPRYLPKYMSEDHSKILICDRNGGSRLYFAQKFDIEIPCIISDYCNRFDDQKMKLLNTENDVRSCYQDQPGRILFDDRGIDIRKPDPVIKIGSR